MLTTNSSSLEEIYCRLTDRSQYVSKCHRFISRNGHMITHRDKKPYECSFSECDKSYSDMRSLKRHLENHHGVPPVSSSSFSSSASHSTQYLAVPRGTNLLHPGAVEDRNNNMKGTAPPERPSSAPSVTPEVRTRSRIRSNSCEDFPIQNESESPSDKEAANDVKMEVEDGAFVDEPKKNALPSSVTDRVESNSQPSENTGHSVTHQERNKMPSPRSQGLHQWPANQFSGANFPSSWNNSQTQWNNAQLVAARMGMAQGLGNPQYMMGYRQPYQQFYSPAYYPGSSTDPTSQLEPSMKKPKQDMIPSSQTAFPQNALQMFASMAAQRTPIPTDMLMNQGAMGCYTDGQSAANKATNPAAIAIAAAKAGSMFCMPHDMRLYGAHPGAAQWQDVRDY